MFHDNVFSGIKLFGKDEWMYISSQFCFISALCIPFDIRDYEKDNKENTLSMPVTLGIKTSKVIAIGLILVYLLLSFFIDTKNLVIIRSVISVISVLVILKSTSKRHRYYFIYLTDGIIILQTLLLYFL